MATIPLTIGKIEYHASDDNTNNWYHCIHDNNITQEIASGYAQRSSNKKHCWWVSRIAVTTPKSMSGSEHDLVLRLKLRSDTNSYPQNSIAVLTKDSLKSGQVVEESENGGHCGCGTTHCKEYHHKGPNDTLFDSITSVESLSYTNVNGYGTPADPSKNTYIYYRFPGFNFSANTTYYIHIMYQKRSALDGGNSTYHGFVGVYTGKDSNKEERVEAYLEYNDNRTLRIRSKLNDGNLIDSLNTYGSVNVIINGTKKSYNSFNQSLAHNTRYTIEALNTDATKYRYDASGSSGSLSGSLSVNTEVALNYKSVYALTFDANGGPTVNTVYKVHGSDATLPGCSRGGYTFLGWKCGNTLYTPDKLTYTANANASFTAQWSANNYTVTFDANGGNLVGNSQLSVQYGAKYGNIPTATKDGYSFSGWYTSKNGGTLVDSNTVVSTVGNHTLYARYGVNYYNITYYYPDGVTVFYNDNSKYTYGGIFTTTTAPKIPGYKFNNWVTRDGETTIGANSKQVYTFTHNLELVASNDIVPSVHICKGGLWKVVVPHVYTNNVWKAVKLNLITANKDVEFDYHNWLS